MRILVCLFPLAAIAAAPIQHKSETPPVHHGAGCPAAKLQQAEGKDRGPATHRLGQEPGARQEIAVQNTVDGCEKPIVVRDDVGGKAPPADGNASPATVSKQPLERFGMR